jgi:hypothetical protein
MLGPGRDSFAGTSGPIRAAEFGYRPLATQVLVEMKKRKRAAIDRASLARLFDGVYSASFQTEEGHPVQAMIAVGSPTTLTVGSARIGGRSDRWRPWALAQPLPFSTENLAKLARATDPRSSAICVDVTADSTTIWGLVDQQDKGHGALVWDVDLDRPPRPGRLLVVIEGIAHLTVWIGYDKIAELRGSSLLSPEIDALAGGPLARTLRAGLVANLALFQVAESLSDVQLRAMTPDLARFWFGAISRVLVRAVAYGSGGTVLITPDEGLVGLSTGYELRYDRLATAIQSRWRAHLGLTSSRQHSTDRSRALDQRERARSELDGVTRFVSLLTRVDGAVVLDPSLTVLRFGSRITIEEAAPAATGCEIPLARNRGATSSRLSSISYDFYGTRHQSVLRYCQTTPGAVGFIVSHDQAIRAATKIGDRVTLWDRVLLRQELRPKRGRPVGRRPRSPASRTASSDVSGRTGPIGGSS